MKSCLKRTKHSRLPIGISPGNSPTVVTFGLVEFREYPYELGDNPSVSSGVPVSISWEFQIEYGFEIDTYERIGSDRSSRLRNRICPKLDVTRRAQM